MRRRLTLPRCFPRSVCRTTISRATRLAYLPGSLCRVTKYGTVGRPVILPSGQPFVNKSPLTCSSIVPCSAYPRPLGAYSRDLLLLFLLAPHSRLPVQFTAPSTVFLSGWPTSSLNGISPICIPASLHPYFSYPLLHFQKSPFPPTCQHSNIWYQPLGP